MWTQTSNIVEMCIYNLKYIRNLQYTLGVVWFQGWIKTLHVKPYYYQFDIHTIGEKHGYA